MSSKKIVQSNYGNLEVDNREKDIVMIWGKQKDESNVIQIQRENIPQLIGILKELNRKKEFI